MIEPVDHFTHPGSFIISSELVTDEISTRIQKAQLSFVNLRHLRCRRDVRLPIKGHIYGEFPVLLYGCEMWPLKICTTLED